MTNSRFTFLVNLVLGVHQKETDADREALRILQQLIDELRPGTELKVVTLPYESEEHPLPRLQASSSVFYGIEQIRNLEKQERLLAS